MIRINIEYPAASGRRFGWVKHVTSVDMTKGDGWAFLGEFLKEGENDLPADAVLVKKVPTGSARNQGWDGIVMRADGTELGRFDWHRQFLSMRDCVKEALA